MHQAIGKRFGADRITKSQAIALFKNASELARRLNITRGAVTNWDDGLIPYDHELYLRFKVCPEYFDNSEITIRTIVNELTKRGANNGEDSNH